MFPEVVPSWKVTLCVTPSEFHTQVTVLPTGTVIVAGLNALFTTETVNPLLPVG
jgi:hypothetical protein